MTVSSTTTKNSYSGNGSTHSFAYGFKIFADADLTVLIRSSTGTETVKTLNTHYIVTNAGNSSGGNVLFKFNTGNSSDAHHSSTDNRPASGETVVIRRNLTLTQGTDYVENDPFPAESHENALDRVTFITQQLQEELDRSIKLSRTNTMTSTEFTNSATDRASKILAFDTSGELAVTQELGTFKGDWAASTAYAVRDIVKDTSTNNIFIVTAAHTSSGSQPLTTNANSAKYSLIVDAASSTTSQTAAASSATAAASSATAAASSASTASTQASNASTSASTASTQATNAANSATAASNAQAAAEAALDTFDDRFLGAKSSDPSVDNDGNALIDGALYFDTTNDIMKVYDLTNTQWRQLTLTSANQTNVNTVAGQISPTNNIATVAGANSNITAVAGSIANVNTTASNISNVNSVAGNESNINSAVSNESNINAVVSNASNINSVAGNSTNINSVAGSITNVNTVASNLASVNNFGQVYRIASSAPTTSLDLGDLYFDTTSDTLKVYGASGWQNAGSSINGTSQRYHYDITGTPTSVTGADANGNTLTYDAGYVDVYVNGVRMSQADVTVTSGDTVTFASALANGDEVDIVGYGTFSVASLNADNLDSGTVPSARVSGAYTGITGTGTLTGLTVNGNLSVDGGTIKLDGNYPIGTQNVALGDTALDSVQSDGNYNTAIGHASLTANTTGDTNSALGRESLLSNTTGSGNTAVGYTALLNNTTASNNTAVGYQSGYSTTGNYLTAVGYRAAYANTSGNIAAFGYEAGYSNTTGTANTAIGRYRPLYSNTTGSSNTAIGGQALYSNTTASQNTAVGYLAGYSNQTGENNAFMGRFAGYSTTGGDNTFIGGNAGYQITTGTKNTILGRYNGNQGNLDIRTSSNNIVLSDGDGSVRSVCDSTGSWELSDNSLNSTLGDRLNIYGKIVGSSQFGISVAGNANTYAQYAMRFYNTYFSNIVGSITFNTTSTTYATSSDHRLKENVVDMTGAIDRVKLLSPKRFNFIADDTDTLVDGFLAHEAQAVVAEAVIGTHNEVDDEGNAIMQGIDQSKIVPLLTGALKEAIAKIEDLEARIVALEGA